MTQELGLSGNELLVYAIIYGFSQTQNQVCACGDEYMATWLNTDTRTIIRIKNQLLARKLIEKVGNGQDNRMGAYKAIFSHIHDKMSSKIHDKMSKTHDKLSCKNGDIDDIMSGIIKKYMTKCPEIHDKMSRASLNNNKYNIKNNNNTTHARVRARGVVIACAEDCGCISLPDQEQAASDWKVISDKLEAEIHALGFDVWIKPLLPVGYYDDTLVIMAPTDEHRAEVIDRYAQNIAEAICGKTISR